MVEVQRTPDGKLQLPNVITEVDREWLRYTMAVRDESTAEERERCVGEARKVLDKHVYMASAQSQEAAAAILHIETEVLAAIREGSDD